MMSDLCFCVIRLAVDSHFHRRHREIALHVETGRCDDDVSIDVLTPHHLRICTAQQPLPISCSHLTSAGVRGKSRFWILKESCEARCQTRFGLNLAVLAAQISDARTVSDSLRLESGRVSAPPGCALDRPKCRAVSRAAWATVVKPGCALDRLRAVSRAANYGLILIF